jgi:hypothetical protein
MLHKERKILIDSEASKSASSRFESHGVSLSGPDSYRHTINFHSISFEIYSGGSSSIDSGVMRSQ